MAIKNKNSNNNKTFRFENIIHKTYDYSEFERLDGNRSVSPHRVAKIIKSVEKVGQLPVPITVNEKMQIIDGQARVQAFEQLGLPIYYCVIEGIGFDECIAMNLDQTNWKLVDYIKSYAEKGNVNYIRLNNLIEQYTIHGIGMLAIIRAASNCYDVNDDIIKAGRYICDETDYATAVSVLNYERKFADIVKQIGGRKDYILAAIGIAFLDTECDKDRLYKKMYENHRYFRKCATIHDCLEELTEIYNNRARAESKIYLHINYQKRLKDTYSWYEARYCR